MTEEEQQEILLTHARNVALNGELPAPAETLRADNAMCGDAVTLSLLVENGRVKEVRAEAQGCFVCRASTSMLATFLQNQTIEQALEISHDFREMMRGKEESEKLQAAGDLMALKGIQKYPVRIKCALLAFDAFDRMHGKGKS